MRPHDHDRTWDDLAAELGRAPGERRTAEAVVLRALSLVDDADWVSLTVRGDRSFVTLAATSDGARQADQTQYALHEGPCVQAAHGDEYYRSGDVGADPRWPAWGPKAAELGMGSLLSMPLSSHGTPLGALNFYAGRPGGFSAAADRDLAAVYAAQAAATLASVQLPGAAGTTGATADVTADVTATRHTIGVAQGILMERHRLTWDASLDLLWAYADHAHVTVADLVVQLVTSGAAEPPVPRRLPAGASLAEAAAVMAASGHPFVMVVGTDAEILSAGELVAACRDSSPHTATVGDALLDRARTIEWSVPAGSRPEG